LPAGQERGQQVLDGGTGGVDLRRDDVAFGDVDDMVARRLLEAEQNALFGRDRREHGAAARLRRAEAGRLHDRRVDAVRGERLGQQSGLPRAVGVLAHVLQRAAAAGLEMAQTGSIRSGAGVLHREQRGRLPSAMAVTVSPGSV
jgi:hypothetical protein